MGAEKNIKVKVDLGPLAKMIKNIASNNNMAVKVGILANKNTRKKGKADSNAAIGVIHEFGSFSSHIPERSFIRMPLQHEAREIFTQAGQLLMTDKEYWKNGNPKPFLKKVGILAEEAIGKAFATGGFGTWAPIKPATEKRKGTDAILIETSQLQRSISSTVVRKGV